MTFLIKMFIKKKMQVQPKQFINDFAAIDLIIGPMFGGKTTELLRRLTVYKEMGLRCCYVNSAYDSRAESAFSTHNKLLSTCGGGQSGNISYDGDDFIAAVKVEDIAELISIADQYDVFGIDEAQLFTNLLSTTIDLADNYHKRIIVAGLNGTSDRRVFGEILYLIPHANAIQKLEPFCKPCADQSKITPALFSKCIVNKASIVMIGGKDMYVAVCRRCYNQPDSPVLNYCYQQLRTGESDPLDGSGGVGGSDGSDGSGEPSPAEGSVLKPLLPPPTDFSDSNSSDSL